VARRKAPGSRMLSNARRRSSRRSGPIGRKQGFVAGLASGLVFTVEQRDVLVERMLSLARQDERVVAAAVVGSLAVGTGDDYSDVDLTFAIAEEVATAAVLDDWTRVLVEELDAVTLADLVHGTSTYRVFLLPDALQLDLSMTPAAEFRPAGPRFRLLFGETAAGESEPAVGSLFISTPAVAEDIFGWGVIYALHARACIERGRAWQAEHYVGAVRDHALSMACVREHVITVQARGYDDLAADTRAELGDAHVGSVAPEALRAALAASVAALLREGEDGALPQVQVVAQRLAELR
jgi:predicted nucleotidyltransferase